MANESIVQPYLFFAGRCDEAIQFYHQALGAETLFLMRFNESPDSPPPGTLESGFEEKVMHATVQIGKSQIMVSDGCDSKTKFSGFRLSVAFDNAEDARKAFEALSKDGQVEMPLVATFWSACFGMLTDKFGVGWMITVQQ